MIVEYIRDKYKIVSSRIDGEAVLYKRFLLFFWRRIGDFYSSYNAKCWIDENSR